jgi:hypothetical protein
MLGLFKMLFGKKPTTINAWWCDSTIKLPAKVQTPLLSNVTVITPCVDIDYTVIGDRIRLKKVRLTSNPADGVNVQAKNGEAWFAKSICDESLLADAVKRDLEKQGSKLLQIMMGKAKG